LIALAPIDFKGEREERSRTGIIQSLARVRFEFAKTLVDSIAVDKQLFDRGHSLIIDSGWREVADTALNFVRRFASTS
jgi:hypothetical protein